LFIVLFFFLDLNLNAVTQQIIGASIRVHIEIGVGLLEYVCEKLLSDELAKQGLSTRTQVPIPVVCNYHKFNEIGFRADLIVNNEVLIEVKYTEGIAPIHCKQVLTYRRLTDIRTPYKIQCRSTHKGSKKNS